jgi:beta-aspartyl-peptidase (threonine type)
VERARDIGWSSIGQGALAAVVAAVRHMEDEPLLNAGIGACLNADGEVELDAGIMEGATLRAGGVACLRDIRHPIDLALAVMEDGRHVLLAADGASRFAHDHGIEQADPSIFITDRKRQELLQGADTVGAVARDSEGHFAVAVSTGGIKGKLPGRIGDSPIPGAGFYADDRFGAVCGTGQGEAFIRLGLARLIVVELEHGMETAAVAKGAMEHLGKRLQAMGGVIVIGRGGPPEAAFNTAAMPFAVAQ